MKRSSSATRPRAAPESGRGRHSRGADRATGTAHPLLAVRLPAWRSRMLLFGLFCGFVALALRVFYLQGGMSTQFLQRHGETRSTRPLHVAGQRTTLDEPNADERS